MQSTATLPASDRARANHAFLRAEMARLRLLLERRVLWLREQWQSDPLQEYRGLVVSDAQADWLMAGPDPAAEAQFYRENPAAAALGRAVEDADAAARRRSEELAAAGMPPRSELLARLFGLTPFERSVLLLCLAAELDTGFERLFGYVLDDATRRHPTAALALSLLAGDDWIGCRRSFLPEAPLRRWRLLTVDAGGGPLASAPLRIDERIAHYLLGIGARDVDGHEAPDGRLAGALLPLSAAPLTARHRDLLGRLAPWVRERARQEGWPVLNLVGARGSGRRALARALCDELGPRLLELRLSRLGGAGPARAETLRLLEREAILLGLAYYVDLQTADEGGEGVAEAAAELAGELGVLVIAASGAPAAVVGRTRLTLPVPKPDPAAQAELWDQALARQRHTLNGSVDAITQQFDLGPTGIVRAVAAARDRALLRDPTGGEALSLEDVWQACREELSCPLEGLAQRVAPRHGWEDLVLPEDGLRHLREIADQVAQRGRVYESWGFGARLGRGRGISALFAGPSGTGKTLAAEILAAHLGLDLFRVDLAGTVSKYIGETEKNLRRIFDAAEESGAILFFDEADALFGKRSEVKDSHDRYANIEINYLLQRMEDYRGLAVLATNMKQHLDPAFLRRLRFVVDFPFPDPRARRLIWQGVFPRTVELDGLDLDALARMEIAGGSIRNIALNAAFLAAGAGTPIGMDHVLRAARREYAKLNKLVAEVEFGAYHARVAT
jgi:hypothetical protein